MSHFKRVTGKRNKMSTCNQMSSAAAKVTMIRRVKNRKSVSNESKTRAVTSVVHQSANPQTVAELLNKNEELSSLFIVDHSFKIFIRFLQLNEGSDTTISDGKKFRLRHKWKFNASHFRIKIPKFMNTYRLEAKNKFNCTLAHSILEEVVNKYCFGFKYDPVKCPSRVQTIAGEIMKRLKKLEFDRYRLIVLVEIGSNKNQEIETVTKFFWDATKDRYSSYNLTSGSMFTCATVFAVYLD